MTTWRSSLIVTALVSGLLAAVSILAVDQPVARAVSGYEPLAFWESGLVALEWGILLPIFKWALGIVFVAAMIACVAVPRWRVHAPAWMFLAATHLIARILMAQGKDLTDRLRPCEWHGGDTFFRGGNAFPSGHVVSFASVVIPIVVLVPRAWPLLGVIGYVMLARILAHAHWVSDTLAGVALTCLVAWVCALAIRPRRAIP